MSLLLIKNKISTFARMNNSIENIYSKFLSSVGSEPAFDGKAGQHSPFATFLLAVLREKGQGSNGIVTLSDIFKVLQTASLNETAALKISPAMADFGNVDAFSEFILIPVGKANESKDK